MSNQQNDEVFVIESPVDAVAFMTALERHLCVLADRYPDISNTRPGIYAGGSMAMVRHGLMHSVNDVDIAFRDRPPPIASTKRPPPLLIKQCLIT